MVDHIDDASEPRRRVDIRVGVGRRRRWSVATKGRIVAGSGQAVMTDTRMRIIFGLVAVMAISFLLIAFAKAQQSTIRDANGRISTTVTTDSNGTKTFRDGTGRTTGTATIDANGMTTFRNASGRITGTASTPRR